MRDAFINSLRSKQTLFELSLSEEQIDRLDVYYELVRKHNPILHLVSSTAPEEFAVRHVLESLVLARFLPTDMRFADVGPGAGLPSIPCLIIRDDLSAVLVEASAKKSRFLVDAVAELRLSDRAVVENKQFQEVQPVGFSSVMCRALDKFTQKLPRLLKWAKGKGLYFFGGPNLEEALTANGIVAERHLMPLSEQRFLFVSRTVQGEAAESNSPIAALNCGPASPE